MQEARIPQEEKERIDELCALCLLDTPPEERFDRITRLAKRLFDVEIALVSLVDVERQWFKSAQGLDAPETPRDISFCGHAILNDALFVIEETHKDARFADNPLVIGAPFIRFYAGIPLRGPRGFRVGTLCVIDSEPRHFNDIDRAFLADLGLLVEAEFNTRELSQTVQCARESEAKLAAILDNVVDGILTIDDRGCIESANPAATRIFGYGLDEMLGSNVSMLMPEPYRSEHDGYLRNYCDSGKAKIIGIGREVVGRRKDGKTFPLDLAVSDMRLAGRRAFSGIVRDISERKTAEQALMHANAQWEATSRLQQAILNSANFSMVSTDMNGIIKTFSSGAQRLLGYSAEEMIDQQSPAVFHDREEVLAHARQLSAELGRPVEPGFDAFVAKARLGMPDETEWTYIRKDGSRVPVMLSVTGVVGVEQTLTGFLGIAYDISERKKIEMMKNEFISTVSHELRTPLTSIRGSLGLILGGAIAEVPQRAQVLLQIAHSNCERLVRLINDILDVEKIESGSIRLHIVMQKIKPLVEQAVQATGAFAAQFGVRLSISQDSEDCFVEIDADRITQALVNLLSNAAKFSPSDAQVDVGVHLADSIVRVSVRDHGNGIPPQFQSRIFQKFAQADSSDTRQKGGTGLGLSISKAIVELHHGRIGFTTEAGQGSEFYVELPIARTTGDLVKGSAHVLVCEDDRDIAKLLGLMLEQRGISSDVAYNAPQAREMLGKRPYAAMTLDLGLPGEDGLSLLNWVRSNSDFADIPIVIVSARAEEGRILAGGAISVIDWLDKPIDESRLVQAIRKAVYRKANPLNTVLHVEDDPDVCSIVTELLQPNLQVMHAATLEMARKRLAERPFGVILLDLNMPDGSGMDLLTNLPEINAQTPVVIFSANDVNAGTLNGIAAALVKARTTNEQLLSTIYGLIGKISEETTRGAR